MSGTLEEYREHCGTYVAPSHATSPPAPAAHLGVPTVSTLVYQLGFSSMNFPLAASLSVVGLLLTAAALLALAQLTRRLKTIGGH